MVRPAFVGHLLGILLVAVSFQFAPGQIMSHAEEYNSCGLSRQRQGDIDGAIDDFTKAIERSSGMAQAAGYNHRANARMSKSDWDGAIADYNKSLELLLDNKTGVQEASKEREPAHTRAVIAAPLAFTYNNRGNARRAKGEVDGAIADYTRALETNPRYAEAYYNRGIALQSQND